MAMNLVNKTSPTNQSHSVFRLSLNFLRSFSTSSPEASNAASSSSPTKKRRKKKKNLFEVAQFLPNWGIGYHMAKSHWKNVSYEITKINLYKDGRHGKAWGTAYKDGVPAEAPKKISGVHKRCWRYIPSLSKQKEGNTSSLSSPQTAPIAEAETA